MTKAQSIKMLTGLGFPLDIATKMSAQIPDTATATPEEEIETALTACVAHQRELHVNSDEYKASIKQIQDAKLAAVRLETSKKIIALAGLTPEEVKDKKFDEIADLAWKKAAKMGDKSIEEVQAELVKVSEELRKVKEEEIPAIQSKVESDRLAFKTETDLSKRISTLKLREGLSAEDAIILVKTKAEKAGYKASFDDKGELSFLNADGSKINAADKKTLMGTNDVLNTFLEGWIEKSNADKKKPGEIIKPEGKETISERNQGSAVNSAMSKAEAHALKLAEGAEE